MSLSLFFFFLVSFCRHENMHKNKSVNLKAIYLQTIVFAKTRVKTWSVASLISLINKKEIPWNKQ